MGFRFSSKLVSTADGIQFRPFRISYNVAYSKSVATLHILGLIFEEHGYRLKASPKHRLGGTVWRLAPAEPTILKEEHL